jgi:hypothetical protein
MQIVYIVLKQAVQKNRLPRCVEILVNAKSFLVRKTQDNLGTCIRTK